MNKVTKNQYEFALERIEELLPKVNEETSVLNRDAVELSLMSDIVIAYEKEYYPMCKALDISANSMLRL